MTDWDLAVVGGGIAGLTAATVAAEHGLRVVALERLAPGGQLVNLGAVSGCPGLPDETSGADLAATLLTGAMAAGVEIAFVEATGLDATTVHTSEDPVPARAVVVATGLMPGRLDVPGAQAWLGRGVSECATCDGPLFAGRPVVVVGEDGWAAQEAVELATVAGSVTVLVPDRPRWAKTWTDRLAASGATVREHATVSALTGDDTLAGVRLADGSDVAAAGVFVQIGRAPNVDAASGPLDVDATGRLVEDPAAGVFVAGDVHSGSVDRLVVAAADGVRAGLAAVVHTGLEI